jgi:hypothetical protein
MRLSGLEQKVSQRSSDLHQTFFSKLQPQQWHQLLAPPGYRLELLLDGYDSMGQHAVSPPIALRWGPLLKFDSFPDDLLWSGGAELRYASPVTYDDRGKHIKMESKRRFVCNPGNCGEW